MYYGCQQRLCERGWRRHAEYLSAYRRRGEPSSGGIFGGRLPVGAPCFFPLCHTVWFGVNSAGPVPLVQRIEGCPRHGCSTLFPEEWAAASVRRVPAFAERAPLDERPLIERRSRGESLFSRNACTKPSPASELRAAMAFLP